MAAPTRVIPVGAITPADWHPYSQPWGPMSAPVGSKSENPRLAKMLQKYEDACAAGDQAKARKLAVRALDIDPACFQKK